MSLALVVNGQSQTFEELTSPAPLAEVVKQMHLKADRVAVEHNGEIAPRARWAEVSVASGDRLEVVHFVGGGICGSDFCWGRGK
jgi:sulfur carrier protein